MTHRYEARMRRHTIVRATVLVATILDSSVLPLQSVGG